MTDNHLVHSGYPDYHSHTAAQTASLHNKTLCQKVEKRVTDGALSETSMHATHSMQNMPNTIPKVLLMSNDHCKHVDKVLPASECGNITFDDELHQVNKSRTMIESTTLQEKEYL